MIKNLKIQFLIGQDPAVFIQLKKVIENDAKDIVSRIGVGLTFIRKNKNLMGYNEADFKIVADIQRAKLKLRSEMNEADNLKNENLAEEIIQGEDAEGFKQKYTERFKEITEVAKNGIFEVIAINILKILKGTLSP
ncbi:unnamed protein product [Meloidogyne enterolobii]|uniref:Uncharacterized protein n=1 Tax=Meloidogyne enterolobii TaxID=390850 RepID=A0ACB1ABX1_MELEN